MRPFINRYKQWWLHLLLWFLYFSYERLSLLLLGITNLNWVQVSLSNLLIIIFFYLHAHYTLYNSFRSRYKLLRFILLFSIQTVLYVALFCSVQYAVNQGHQYANLASIPLRKMLIASTLYRYSYVIFFSSTYYFLGHYFSRKHENELLKERIKSLLEKEKSEKELQEARTDFLKAQIKPHLLFNALDFVYHKVEIGFPEAAEAIQRLSEMMRYAMDTGSESGHVFLDEEIRQLENLVRLDGFSKENRIEINYTPAVLKLRLIPLVLLTLAENMIKHGTVSTATPALMNISIEGQTFIVETRNFFLERKARSRTSTGLENLRKRLTHAYNDEFDFHYEKSGGNFLTRLSISVNNLMLRDDHN